MRIYAALVKKELRTLFVSPIAYVVLAVFFAIAGFFFNIITESIIGQVDMMSFQAQQLGQAPQPIDVPGQIFTSFFSIVSTLLLFLIPMITMSSFAEERKRGTMELLLTSPLTRTQLVLGKFTALLAFVGLMLVPTLLNCALVYAFSEPRPSLGPLFAAFLGALLLAATLLAIGIFVSSLTENQIVSAVVTFGLFLVLWVLDAAAGSSSSLGNETLRYLSVINHYEDFTQGVIDTRHLVFFGSMIFLGIFLTSVSLDSDRWRQ